MNVYRQPQAKYALHYDKLVVDKEVYTFNDISAKVENTMQYRLCNDNL